MCDLGQGKHGITHLHACKWVSAHCVQGCVWCCWRPPGVLASPGLQGAQGLVLSDCAKGGHGIPDTVNSAESRAGVATLPGGNPGGLHREGDI